MTYFRRVFAPLTVFLLLVFVFSGCSRVRPIYQVENHPIVQHSTPLTLKQIETGIRTAGRAGKWRLRPIGPGQMEAKTSWGKHSAVITITYSLKSFTIRYKSSVMLRAREAQDYDPGTGGLVIHRRYNSRIRALENAIDGELSFPVS